MHLESDADEQLLLYIPFTQVVKLYSVVVKGPEEEGIFITTLLKFVSYSSNVCAIVFGGV